MESSSDRPLDFLSRPATPERGSTALELVLQALRAPEVSLERLRAGVVRYGRIARDQAMQLEEMLSSLTRAIRDALESLPSPRRDELLAFVQWWAVHGYHRAD